MAVGWKPTIGRNTVSQQRQIDKIGTKVLGPVSVGPDEGGIRFYTDTGDTFYVSATGAQVKFNGGLTGLTPHLEQNAEKNAAQDSRLGSAESRLDGHDSTLSNHSTRLGSAESRLDGHDGTLSSHSTRISNAQSSANAAATAAGVAKAAADAAQADANSANSTNRTQAGQISSLQSKVSGLESQVSGSASSSDVTGLAIRVANVEKAVVDVQRWLSRNTPYPSDYPNPGA